MQSRLRSQTYGLACLVIFIVIVLAACESGPGVAAPTKSAAIGELTLAMGQTGEVDFGKAFTGEKLTFLVTSSNYGVAFPRIAADNRNIVIRAIDPGTATITVTATNSGGSATQSFNVTVPRPTTTTTTTSTPEPTSDNPSDCPSSLPSTGGMFKITLEIIRDRSGKCTLPANHSLIYDDSSAKVSVHGPGEGNVWTITALKKGSSDVKINNDQTGETAGTITVIVPNTPPRLMTTSKGPQMEGLLLPNMGYITLPLDPGMHFEDDDTDDQLGEQGSFRFKVLDKPDGVLIDTDRGFVAVRLVADPDTGGFDSELTSAAVNMRAAILKNPGETFDILLHAYDRDNDVSDNPVRLRFDAQDPQSGMYAVGQNTDGDFTILEEKKKLKIGNRIGVGHTISIAAATDSTGFRFAEIRGKKLSDDRRIPDPPNHTFRRCNANEPESWRTTQPGLGTMSCYSISDGNNNDLDILMFTGTSVEVLLSSEHRGLNETSGATITITYHVWALSGAKSGTSAVLADDMGSKTIDSSSKQLALDIHRCEVTTDCPLE